MSYQFRGSTDAGFIQLPYGNETALEIAVATVGPISVAISVPKSFMHYKSGVYEDVYHCSVLPLTHEVLVVGYGTDEASGMDYWLVKNCWGEKWGERGYVKMAKGKDNMCGIADSATYPIV